MAKLTPFLALFSAAATVFPGDILASGGGNPDLSSTLCRAMDDYGNFDEALAYIQAAQGFLTGTIDENSVAACPDSALSKVVGLSEEDEFSSKFMMDQLAARALLDSPQQRYDWDVRSLFFINLMCDSDWTCGRKEIEFLIAHGLPPAQSLVFCGFDAAPLPEPSELREFEAFRRPSSLPFICDELKGGEGVSEDWAISFSDYFDARN